MNRRMQVMLSGHTHTRIVPVNPQIPYDQQRHVRLFRPTMADKAIILGKVSQLVFPAGYILSPDIDPEPESVKHA
jgi:hypothetical protein